LTSPTDEFESVFLRDKKSIDNIESITPLEEIERIQIKINIEENDSARSLFKPQNHSTPSIKFKIHDSKYN
jgi:hypothetical protein